MFRFIAIALCFSWLPVGCATMEHAGLDRKRQEQWMRYDHEVRWGALAAMYDFLKPEVRPTRPPVELDNIRVTAYEELGRTPVSEHEVIRRVRIEYVIQDRQVVKQLVDRQRWRYHPEEETWLRANPPPEFRP